MDLKIDIKSSTAEKAMEMTKEFLGKLVGPTVDELGLTWADGMKVYRLKRQVANLAKVKAIVDEHKIDIKRVKLKVLVPYLDGIALEDDENIQDLWANLFTNYIDASKNLNITLYPSILSQLSTEETKILKHMSENDNLLDFSNDTFDESGEVISNLKRLGLIDTEVTPDEKKRLEESFGGEKYEMNFLPIYYLTDFGVNFIVACTR